MYNRVVKLLLIVALKEGIHGYYIGSHRNFGLS